MVGREAPRVPEPAAATADTRGLRTLQPSSNASAQTSTPPSSLDGRFTGVTEILGIHPRAEADDPLTGRTIGNVTIAAVLAEGGMSRIYTGRQKSPDRAVAVKVLRPGFITAEGVRRFAREAEILGSSSHPSIAQVFWAGVCDILGSQVPFIVMELVPHAKTITEFVRAHPADLSVTIALFRKVCGAVAHAHAAGIVHRDLKPGNILIDGLGNPKLIDFGIARLAVASDDQTALTESGRLLGTVRYMSPEQLTGDSASVDARSDVYALGLLLHELLTGRLPYSIDPARIFDAARIVRERAPIVLRSTPERGAWAGLEAVVRRCLELDPTARYQDAGRLAEAIDTLGALPSTPSSPGEPRRGAGPVVAAVAVVTAMAGLLAVCARTLPSSLLVPSKQPTTTDTRSHALSMEAAQTVRPIDGILTFTDVASIPRDVAETLVGRGQRLRIYGLDAVSPQLAAILGRNRQGIELWGVRTVTPEIAASLARTGGPLCLDGVKTLDVASATALASHRDWLNLGGLTDLPEDVLAALVIHRGHGMAIRVPGTLDTKRAEWICRHRGVLYLLGLDTVTTEAARSLAAHHGPIYVDAAHVSPEVDRLLSILK